ncbi:hypothetical protein NQ318_004134 [Aromia moschata]|uniref:RRM domain-containing protein n=1 Tax=Aromia moschata TaxID=1265417 RepID=A0AAV8YNZ4_9CUCU|nr:hypothetical protein NQ318_004134 [Aromia moschata]
MADIRLSILKYMEYLDGTILVQYKIRNIDAEEDELWKLFETCGPISYEWAKGFAYVNFKDADAVQLALEMDNIKLRDRELRISLCNLNGARKKKNNKNKNKAIARPGRGKPIKNRNQNENKDTSSSEKQELNKNAAPFQGTKFSDKKKKHKVNKGLLQKKKDDEKTNTEE